MNVDERINARLKVFSDARGVDYLELSRRIWQPIVLMLKIESDRGPLPGMGAFPTVAAAIKEMRQAGNPTVAAALATAALRDDAFLSEGRRRARTLLNEAAQDLLDRSLTGEPTLQPDGRWSFQGTAIPLREFVTLPAERLESPSRNTLRSRLFRKPTVPKSSTERLAAMTSRLYAVLWPFYETTAHHTTRERLAGVRKSAKYPTPLLTDIADLINTWRDHEFGDLTADRIRGSLRHAGRRPDTRVISKQKRAQRNR